MDSSSVIPVILCGGSGKRLWPLSHEGQPKQFLALDGHSSLLQETACRAMRVAEAPGHCVVTVTLEKFREKVLLHLGAIDTPATDHILSEPLARNTAPAVAFAATYVKKTFEGDPLMWVLPSDHVIGHEESLRTAFRSAVPEAQDGRLVTFGIPPQRPETGYGYIRKGEALNENIYHVAAFTEKPDIDTARTYLTAGDYLWNSGMFLFRAGKILAEFEKHAPDILAGLADYTALAPHSFDKAIMEKSGDVVTVACDPAWADIGSWESLLQVIGEK